MWPDNETDRDFLNFTGVAETVAEIVVQAQGRPISIGVSGAWGVGKSSMIKLIRRSLRERAEKGERDFIFVEFNAWLYQGYDDARAALMEVIATTLTEEAEKRKKGIEKAAEFLERINWFRLAKLAASSAVALSVGMPPVGLLGELLGLGKSSLAETR
jgi:predicted KAP-like P-loop ATPase